MMPWVLTDITGNDVTFSWVEPQVGLVVRGIPQLLNLTTNETPNAIALPDAATVVLTYDTAPDLTQLFTLPAFDTAIRSPWGGFVSAGQWGGEPPPPAPTEITWTALSRAGNEVQIQVTSPGALSALTNPDQWADTPNVDEANTMTNAFWVGGSVIALQFTSDPSEGQGLIVPPNCTLMITDDGGRLEAKTETLP